MYILLVALFLNWNGIARIQMHPHQLWHYMTSAQLFESQLTLIYEQKLIEVFISLFKIGFKA